MHLYIYINHKFCQKQNNLPAKINLIILFAPKSIFSPKIQIKKIIKILISYYVRQKYDF